MPGRTRLRKGRRRRASGIGISPCRWTWWSGASWRSVSRRTASLRRRAPGLLLVAHNGGESARAMRQVAALALHLQAQGVQPGDRVAAYLPNIPETMVAFLATVSIGGDLAWSRRRPEGGDWQLVVERGGHRRAIGTRPGVSWLFPTFAGDGSGLFALRMEGTALMLAWIPFTGDGPPGPQDLDAAWTATLTVQGNLSTAARAAEPSSGLSASPPRRGATAR